VPGLPGSPLGFHSWDAGISESLVFWTTLLPRGSAEVDLDAGTAELHAENICAVFDAFTVPNSLSPTRPLGFASGMIDSLDIEWSNVVQSFVAFSDPVNHFAGDFFQVSNVTIAVTATTPVSTGHGFRFVSDPTTTIVNFAQIGSERNGVFFS
jgi:hypothetical protein